MSPARSPHRLGMASLAVLLLTACASKPPETPVASQNPIYGQFDEFTQRMAAQTVQTALESRASGDTQIWHGQDGQAAHVTPLRSFRILTGHYCRDFDLFVQASINSVAATRTACRSPEGQWIDVTAQKATPES